MKALSLTRLVVGLVFGFIGYFAIQNLVDIQPQVTKNFISLISAVAFGIAGIYVIPVATKWVSEAVRGFSRRVAADVISQLHIPRMPSLPRPNREEPKEKWVNPIFVDTSALIDGRIAEVVETGFLFGTVLVPDFILAELQNIADNADSMKRGRGRRGLDVLDQIKKSSQLRTVIFETGQTNLKGVDERLLKLAKNFKGKLLTNDFNLNKVATVSGVKILNINELTNAVKTQFIPGEELEVKVVQMGKEKTQGVGYLPDGTMIVVENGAGYLGKKIQTKVSRVIQTVAGRMIFTQPS